MTEPLGISIEALAAPHGSALMNMVEPATLNSFGKAVEVIEEPQNQMQFSIQKTSDEVKQRLFALTDTDIYLKNGAENSLDTLSDQYSMLREVHLDLMIGYI